MATLPVVVGTDGSEESLLAVEWAAMEAIRHGAPLRIVSAPAPLPRIRAAGLAPQTVANALRGVASRGLAAAISRSAEITVDLLVDTDLLTGSPAAAVTDSGAGALMLVVGARGAGGFPTMLLGSVSRYAAMHAPCPVVVARMETTAVTREVAVGIWDPQDASATLDYAFKEAAVRGATLVAVHSCRLPSAPGSALAGEAAGQHPAPGHIPPADAVRNLAEVLARWHDKYPEVQVRHDVVVGHPAKVLVGYTARADLVVIGRQDATMTDPAVGAVQHAVLNHARGPVAIVPS